MSKNTSVLLGDHYQNFISTQVKTGRFSSASEVVRAALRLMEEEETHKIKMLQKALEAGEQSGLAVPYDGEKFRAEMMAKYVHTDA
jgi:antitoxin ParD1/3/4